MGLIEDRFRNAQFCFHNLELKQTIVIGYRDKKPILQIYSEEELKDVAEFVSDESMMMFLKWIGYFTKPDKYREIFEEC